MAQAGAGVSPDHLLCGRHRIPEPFRCDRRRQPAQRLEQLLAGIGMSTGLRHGFLQLRQRKPRPGKAMVRARASVRRQGAR